MKAITYHGRRDIRMSDLPLPELGPDDVYINVKDTLLSQSIIDFHLEGHLVDLTQPHPVTQIGLGYIMGQQFGGIIEKVGENVDPKRIGEYVAVAPGIGCKTCEYCLMGQQNFCEKFIYFGFLGGHGGLAEACAVPAENAIKAPGREWGLMLECMLVAKSLLRKSEPWINKSEPILILGAGPVGISAAILLEQLYGAEYYLYDILPQRAQRAQECGYRVLSTDDLDGKYRLVLDCAGTNPETGGSALLDGLGYLKRMGALMVVGTYLHSAEITPLDLLLNEMTLGGSFAYSDQDLISLLNVIPKINLNIDGLTESITLDQVIGEGLLRGEAERDGFTILAVSQ